MAYENYDYGCLMCTVEIPAWSQIVGKIDTKDLTFGPGKTSIENNPHVTILYGFHSNVRCSDLVPYLFELDECHVWAENISLFENEKYDVIKFGLASDELNSMHRNLKEMFDNSYSFDEYNPHMTIAYVKSGLGRKYIVDFKRPILIKLSKYYFSSPWEGKLLFTK